jgi:ribose transport system permease protein
MVKIKEPAPAAATAPEATLTASRDDRPAARRFWADSEAVTTTAVFAVSIVLILASRAISPAFGGWSQTQAILILSSFVMILGFGQGLVILLGGLDLSVASTMTLGGVLAFTWIGSSTAALLWGVPAVLLATALVGWANGLGITLLRVPPFIMTLAMGIIVYSICLGFTQGTPSGQASPFLSALYQYRLIGVPVIVYLLPIAALFGHLLQSRTPFGRKLYAIGTSEAAAFVAGINVRRLTIATYAISGACGGLAGIMMVGYAGGATLTMGQPYLLPSIAAVVVGGTSILGGRGNYLGTVGGAILLTTISTIIGALELPEGWRTVIYGAVILLALLLMRERILTAFERRFGRGGAR